MKKYSLALMAFSVVTMGMLVGCGSSSSTTTNPTATPTDTPTTTPTTTPPTTTPPHTGDGELLPAVTTSAS